MTSDVITINGVPAFHGEAMMLSWGDSDRAGMTVRFQLDPETAGEINPFKHFGSGKHGQKFALVAVPIAGDEQHTAVSDSASPVQRPAHAPAVVSERPGISKKPLTLAAKAGILCNDAAFQRWLIPREEWAAVDNFTEYAAGMLRVECEILSRRELDTNPEAARKFSALVAEFERATGRQAERRG